jgi:hypothetical protein
MHPMSLLQRLRAMLSENGTLLFGSMMLGLSDGPPGEFPTVNGYFRAHKGEPAEASTFP